MPLLSTLAAALMAILHIYILVLEMFLWTTPRGRKAFKLTPAFADQTKTMAANQGLYNGFLSAGLIWALVHPDAAVAKQLEVFFLGCILVAGVYGGLTANRKIVFIQGVPAGVGLAVVLLGL